MNFELGRMWKEAVMASFTVLNIPEEMGKTTRNISEDLLKYKALVVPTKYKVLVVPTKYKALVVPTKYKALVVPTKYKALVVPTKL
jgi:hypothetical protein